jgi:hypothetical protein
LSLSVKIVQIIEKKTVLFFTRDLSVISLAQCINLVELEIISILICLLMRVKLNFNDLGTFIHSKRLGARGMAQMVERLPSKCKARSSKPSITKKKKKKN